MANRTVYPYGTDGQLPSSIGIINDLTTGGADKALSAEMGVVLNDKMTAYELVDLSQITQSNYSPGNTGLWNATQGRHKVIPVTPGSEWRIMATSNGGWYLWLTSSYTVPTTSTSVPYCTGSTRMWAVVDTYYFITAPADAAYLCVCPVDGAGNASAWSVGEKTNNSAFLTPEDVIDNIQTAESDKALSANQGKHLAEIIGAGIPVGATKHSYDGAAVRVAQHYVAATTSATITSQSCQGGACFGDYLFMFTENNTTCWMYDLSAGSLVQTITIASADRGFVSNCHCNTVNFGTEFYDPADDFPLLYVSTGYNDGTDSGALVYRIVEAGGVYSLSLVQTLKMPGTGWTEFVVGNDGCCYLCYTGTRTIYRMAMPLLSDGDLTFDLQSALQTYQFTEQPAWYNGSRNQNRIYYDGKIYMVSGVPASGETLLFIALNLETQTRDVEIDLGELGFSAEPETLFIRNNHFNIVFRSTATVYALYFE